MSDGITGSDVVYINVITGYTSVMLVRSLCGIEVWYMIKEGKHSIRVINKVITWYPMQEILYQHSASYNQQEYSK